MKFALPVVVSVIGLLCIARQAEPARILAMVPVPSYSHQIPYWPLWLELHNRGHEIVLVSPNSVPNVNSTRFKQIDIGAVYNELKTIDFVKLRMNKHDWLAYIENYLIGMCDSFAEQVLNHTDMKALYAPDSNAKFDLVMAEMLTTPAAYAFAHRFNAPLIGLTSLGIMAINEHTLGGVVLPSHEYTWELEANAGTNQPFWKRLLNFVRLYRILYLKHSILYPRQQKLVEKYFGTAVPSLFDIQKNTSLIFVNQADAITAARPKLANMITFTSFHVEKNPPPLPEDLKRFVDGATEGFIYFSLGSNARSAGIPKETLQVFLDVFAKLPYKIVWKFEEDMPNKPDNIFVGKWLPQQSILAHPNIKMFIYQGGLQSSEEAVHFTVPLLGFPILADQDYQVLRMEALGVAKYMEITTVTREELEAAIREIINNKQYKQKIVELKKLVNDNPYNMVEHLAWWTEYVIRHKGAPHLRSNLAHQPWYQRCDMDIVIFLTIVAVLIISNITSIIAKLAVRSYNHYQRMSTRRKEKIRESDRDSRYRGGAAKGAARCLGFDPEGQLNYIANNLTTFPPRIILVLPSFYVITRLRISCIYDKKKRRRSTKHRKKQRKRKQQSYCSQHIEAITTHHTSQIKDKETKVIRLQTSTMRFNLMVVVLAIGLLCIVRQADPARILALVPTPSYSHQIPYRRLWLELHERGHEIVLVTANPIPNMNSTTFKQIDVTGMYKDVRVLDFIKLRFDKVDWLTFVEEELFEMADNFAEHVLNHTDMKPIYAPNSNEKFDLVMVEMLAVPATYAFAHRFNAPLIGLSSLGIMSLTEHALGGVVLPSHEYTWEMEANAGTSQPFWRRLLNFLKLSRFLYLVHRDLYPRQQKLAEKYFGTNVPPMLDIQKNTSLIFVNQADAIVPARPKLANMITFTSFHVEKNQRPLPEDLKRFMDSATEGFIYFSLGSNARSADMPKETLQVFLDVFAKLPYKIVWKFEKDMPNKPDNIFVGKWFPQQSILAHPNIKMFIYQGGLQSSEEAVHFSVPLLGFPILADQDYQVLRMQALGVAKYMEITTVTREELDAAIREIITNKQYKQRIVELQQLVNDNPYNMAEHLAWWAEYVIRHKGAPHLRSNLAHQPWYQRCDMDIVIFLTTVAVLIVMNVSGIIAKFAVRFYNGYRRVCTLRKEKVS
ncbi:uncharacterized protein LOC143354610 [Halictus rubicundus]|uniref:uncharacterized protein LOC143354610 n=1 Tax=Halictus rubicundus TaxID=77578 RepID=UPI0040363716